MAVNYDDVLSQLQGAGLLISSLETSGKMVRCRVDGGGREQRGWYVLHELSCDSGDLLVVGTYGVWRGNEPGTTKVELRKRDSAFSTEQREALKRRMAEDRKRAEAERRFRAEQAAKMARRVWDRCSEQGDSAYLASKSVSGFGVRYGRTGAAVLPLLDVHGGIHGLQVLRSAAQAKAENKPAKEFFPAGLAKKGHFHLIGGSPQALLLVAEGYATAASLHMATGYPVAVAFDAGNLLPVAEALPQHQAAGVRR